MELENLNREDPKFLYLQIADIIERKIIDKTYPVGKRIPTVRDLCREFKVSITTMQDALAKLEGEEYIARRRSLGTLVINSEPRTPALLKRKNGVYMVVCSSAKYASFDLSGNTMNQMILRGMEENVKKHGAFLGYTVIYNEETELALGNKENELAGLVVVGGKTGRQMKIIRKMNIPYVLIGDLFENPGSEVNADIIANNDFEGTYMAAKHLTDLGHRRIVYFHEPLEHPWDKEKLEGYKKALKEAKVDFDENLLIEVNGFTQEYGYKIMKEFLSRAIPFSGIISYGDSTIYGITRAVNEKGLRIPEDISLVDAGLTEEFTHVFYDMQEMGRLAFDRLYYRLTNPAWKPERIIMPHKLHIKDSTKRLETVSTNAGRNPANN
jgi:DNA-binding LacI/PurR family transcriptional regulator